MLYRDIEIEKYWDLPNTDPRKKEKIHNAILTENYGATIKKDGEHIRAIYDTDGEIYILGRGTDAKSIHNLDKHLVFITQWIVTYFKPGTCIFGELYVPGKTSRVIRAYTGSLVPKSLKNQKDCPPIFYIFDAWAIDGQDLMDTPFKDRMKILSILAENYKYVSQIEFTQIVIGSQEIFDFIAEIFEKGEEGVVLSRLDSIPAPGKRTAWKSIKVKKEFQNNIDCFFTGNWREPTREYTGSETATWPYWENIKTNKKYNINMFREFLSGDPVEPITKPYFMGWAGSFEVGVYKENKIIPICYLSGMTDEFKQLFKDNSDSIIMKPIAITGMEATDASIRHPKFVGFRDDITLEECTWDKIFGEN